MYWNSMWDNKIIFNRFLKEDEYLNKFFNLIFVDNISSNIFKIKEFKNIDSISNQYIYKDKNSFKKYLHSINNINCFLSKIWILRYQHWLIVYNFLFISKSNKHINSVYQDNYFNYRVNFFYLFKYYLKINKNLNLYYSFYKTRLSNPFF